MNSYLLVLGDSHVRAFSRSSAFMPMFVGPGKEINFNSSDNARKTTEAFMSVLSALDLTQIEHFIFYASEPSTRVSTDGEQVQLEKKVGWLIDCVTLIRETFRVDPIVIAAPPTDIHRQNKNSKIFNGILSEECWRRHFICINLWNETASQDLEEISIVPEFRADGIHLNTTFGDRVSEILLSAGLLDQAGTEIELDYSYDVMLRGKRLVRIRCGARMSESEIARARSAAVLDRLNSVARAFETTSDRIVCLGCGDGLPVFSIFQANKGVVGIDNRSENIRFARRLANLLGCNQIEFLDASKDFERCEQMLRSAHCVLQFRELMNDKLDSGLLDTKIGSSKLIDLTGPSCQPDPATVRLQGSLWAKVRNFPLLDFRKKTRRGAGDSILHQDLLAQVAE